MRTPARFRAETKYTETTEKKANTNLPLMARVGDGGGVGAVVGRDNFYWVRMYNDPNRVTQCYSVLPLANDDWIYMAKARDRNLTYYEFAAFIQLAGGGTGPPVQVHDHSAVAQGGNTIDLNGGADNLILDADGDTTISAPVDDQIDFEIAGADDFTMTANAFNVLAGSAIVMADAAWIGNSVATARLGFDSSAVTDYAYFMSCNVGIGTLTPAVNLEVIVTTGTAEQRLKNNVAVGVGDAVFTIDKAAGGNSAVFSFRKNAVEAWQIGTGIISNNEDFHFYGNAAEVVRFVVAGAIANTLTLNAGNIGMGAQAIVPATLLELGLTETLAGNVADDYAAALTLDPGYTGAFTVSRHNYVDCQDVSVAGGAAVTNAALVRFDAAIGTHKCLLAAFQTTDSGADTTNWAGGLIINILGTLYKLPFVAV